MWWVWALFWRRYSLHFIEASDDGLFDDDVYAARLDKEAAAVKVCHACYCVNFIHAMPLQQWHHDTDKFETLAELHAWLFATHMCYSVNRQVWCLCRCCRWCAHLYTHMHHRTSLGSRPSWTQSCWHHTDFGRG